MAGGEKRSGEEELNQTQLASLRGQFFFGAGSPFISPYYPPHVACSKGDHFFFRKVHMMGIILHVSLSYDKSQWTCFLSPQPHL